MQYGYTGLQRHVHVYIFKNNINAFKKIYVFTCRNLNNQIIIEESKKLVPLYKGDLEDSVPLGAFI